MAQSHGPSVERSGLPTGATNRFAQGSIRQWRTSTMMTSLLAVVETELYIAQAAKLMDEAERAAIVDAVAGAPMMGVLIKCTKGLRKMRIALQGRVKRGGGRLIYSFHSEGYPAVLLMVYAKNTAADLTNEQRRRLIAVSEMLLKDFGDGK